jgi:hypothetical protein
MSPAPRTTIAGRLTRGLRAFAPLRRNWVRQGLLFLAAYLMYELSRTLATGAEPHAVANARRVLGAEAALGIDVEAAAQRVFHGTPWLTVLSWVYLIAQPVVIPAVVIWAYRRSQAVYRVLRNTLIAAWLVALPVYALFPTAPPRLAGVGLQDSVSAESGVALQSDFTTLFYNPFAAVPSLHAGFAVAVGLAVAAAARSRAARLAGLLWGPVVGLATVVTANHFVLDLGAGLAVTAMGLGIGLLIARGPRPALRPGAPGQTLLGRS